MDELYKLAYEYRETKLWKKMYDTDIIAVKLPNNEIAYVSIMGLVGEYNAIGIYIGDEGFHYLDKIFNSSDIISDYESFKNSIEVESLQLVFGNKSDVNKDEAEAVRKFKKENNIKVYGRNQFPHIRKSRLYRPLGQVKSEEDKECIKEVTRAVIDFAKIFEDKGRYETGLEKIYKNKKDIPLLEKVEGKYELNGKIEPKWDYKLEYPVANNIDKKLVSELRKIKKSNNIIQCEIMAVPTYLEDINGFAQLLLVVEEDSEFVTQGAISDNYIEDPDGFVNDFLNNLIKSKINPIKIKCIDERTYSLLKNLSELLNIKIELDDDLELLEEAINNFLDMINSESEEDINQVEDAVQMVRDLMLIEDEYLEDVPAIIVENLVNILKSGILDEFTESILREKLSCMKYYRENYE